MKFFSKIVLILLLLSFIIVQVESETYYELSTDDIENPSILNTLGPVDILDLSGYYCIGKDIERFKIISLPDPSAGILYMQDGETEVRVGQILDAEEADHLRFDPNSDFVGKATFQYASVNSNGEVDPNPATVTIPIYARDTEEDETSTSSDDENETVSSSDDENETTSSSTQECLCENYNSTPSMSLWGVLTIVILTFFIAKREF